VYNSSRRAAAPWARRRNAIGSSIVVFLGIGMFSAAPAAAQIGPRGPFIPPDFWDGEDARVFCLDGSTGCPCEMSFPEGLAVGDVTGKDAAHHGRDGYPDVAVANSQGLSVVVFRNTQNWGGGSPPGLQWNQAPIDVSAWSAPQRVAFAEMNPGDDTPTYKDLIVATRSHVLIFYYNWSTGEFETFPAVVELMYPEILFIQSMAVADLDGNGLNDIVVVGGVSETSLDPRIAVLWHQSVGVYSKQGQSVPTAVEDSKMVLDVAAAKYRNSAPAGRLDLLATLDEDDLLIRALNNGYLEPFTTDTLAARPSPGLAFGQFRPWTGNVDLVISDGGPYAATPGEAHVFWNTDGEGDFDINGTYQLRNPIETAEMPFGVATGTLSPADAYVDIAVACQSGFSHNGGGVAVLMARGNGTFYQEAYLFDTLPASCQPAWTKFVEIGDMNRDGQNDLVASNLKAGSISVLLNKGG
jgi:hypothetical protein